VNHWHTAGFVSYEAASVFDSALRLRSSMKTRRSAHIVPKFFRERDMPDSRLFSQARFDAAMCGGCCGKANKFLDEMDFSWFAKLSFHYEIFPRN
jgi:hypothetical protein